MPRPAAVPRRTCTDLSPAANFNKGPKYSAVGLADLKFGMPLHSKTRTATRIFDPLDDTVLRESVDDEARPSSLDRLMMRTVNRKVVRTDDAVEEGADDHPDGMPWLVARIWLAMRQAAGDFV